MDVSSSRNGAASPRPSRPLATWCALLLLIGSGVAAYSNTFRVPFLLDDKGSIQDNATIRQLWPVGPVLAAAGRTGQTYEGRPLVNLSLAINYAIGELDVRGYHVVNLTIHLLAGLVLFGVVRRSLRLPRIPESLQRRADPLAMMCAVAWTLHPMQTESVTYIVQRAEAIVGLFYLMTLYCVIRGADSVRPRKWYAAAFVACLLGMASKEVMATAPLMVLLFDSILLAGSLREALRRRWPLHLALASTWLLLAALVIRTGNRGGSAGLGTMSSWEYGRTQFGNVVRYLRQAVWPDNLVFDYGMQPVDSFAKVWPEAAILAALLAFTIVALLRWPKAGFAAAWVFVVLAPTSSVIPVVTQVGAEHRMYLPLAGVVVLGVVGGYWAWMRLLDRAASRRAAGAANAASAALSRIVPAIAGGVLVLLLGRLTYARNQDYRDAATLWHDSLVKMPANARAHYSVALELMNAKQPAPAVDEFTEALRLKPDYAECCYNRAVAFEHLGKVEQAIADYTRAIQIKPDAQSYYNRGNDYQQMRKPDLALADYDKAIELHPEFPLAYNNRAALHYLRKEYDQAWSDIRTCRKQGGVPSPALVTDLARASGRSE